MISIIIPAHNEEKSIKETLLSLQPEMNKNRYQIIVICNGCVDSTARMVREVDGNICCVETSFASKTNAINIGNKLAGYFPRVYLDADVLVTPQSITELVKPLVDGDYLATSPTMIMDYNGSSWFVQAYYSVWRKLKYVRQGFMGSGVYALSVKGKERVGELPRILSDDGYVRAHFNLKERFNVRDAYSVVRAPKSLKWLLKIKIRSKMGNYELAGKYRSLDINKDKHYISSFCSLVKYIDLWPKIPIYLYVNLMARYLAKKKIRQIGYAGWERDLSNRTKVN